MKQKTPVEECQEKIRYYNKRIDEELEKLYILLDIQNKKTNLTCEQTNKQTGKHILFNPKLSAKVLPKGWNNE